MKSRSSVVVLSVVQLAAGFIATSAFAQSKTLHAVLNLPADTLSMSRAQRGELETTDSRLNGGEFVDYFRFEGVAGQRVSVTVESPDFDTYLIFTGAGLSQQNDDAYEGVTDSRLEVVLPETGTYELGVTSYAAGESGAYTVVISQQEEQYSFVSNEVASADSGTRTIALGEAELGDISSSDEADGGIPFDRFSMMCSEGEHVRLSLSSDEFDTVLSITGPGGFSQENDDGAGLGTDSRIDFVCNTQGEYQIRIRPYDASGSGSYTLSARPRAEASATVSRLTPGPSVSGNLSNGDGLLDSGEFHDLYDLQLEAGRRMRLSMVSADFDTYLMVRGPDGFSLDNDDLNSDSTNAGLIVTAPVTGDYRVYATSYEPGSVGSYELSATDLGANVSAAPTVISSGQPIRGNLDGSEAQRSGGQFYRIYTFESAGNEHANITLNSRDFDAYLILKTPDGSEEIADDLVDGGTDSALSLHLDEPGVYRILASTYGSGETGAFELSLNSGSIDDAIAEAEGESSGILEFDRQTNGRLRRNDQTLDSGEFFDVWTITGTAGQGFTLNMTSSDFDSYLIVDGHGMKLENDDGGPDTGTNARIEGNFPESGTYTVIATSYAAEETGRYSLSLTEGTSIQQINPGKVYAILAGVTDYGGMNDLPYCADDAVKLDESLRQSAESTTVVLTDSEVSVANIEQAFRQLAPRVTEDDVFLFFYSGHGNYSDSNREFDGRDETLSMPGGEELSDDQLNNWFGLVNSRLSIIALDSCFSGGFARDVISERGRVGIFSSEEDVTSNVAERFSAGGYLSYFLRNALAGAADADPSDGVITVGELTQYLRRQWNEAHAFEETSITSDDATTYQNLVIDRGSVKVSDVLMKTGTGK